MIDRTAPMVARLNCFGQIGSRIHRWVRPHLAAASKPGPHTPRSSNIHHRIPYTSSLFARIRHIRGFLTAAFLYLFDCDLNTATKSPIAAFPLIGDQLPPSVIFRNHVERTLAHRFISARYGGIHDIGATRIQIICPFSRTRSTGTVKSPFKVVRTNIYQPSDRFPH